MNRWSKTGLLNRVLEKFHPARIVRIRIEAVALDSASSTIVKGTPDCTGAAEKTVRNRSESPAADGTTTVPMLAANARTATTFSLSPGQARDAPEGRKLLSGLGGPHRPMHLIVDRAYEGNDTRQLVLELGFTPVVPLKLNQVTT
jgi:hypothetical protein